MSDPYTNPLPALPHVTSSEHTGGSWTTKPGVSELDYYAAAVLGGLAASGRGYSPSEAAGLALDAAEAVLLERDRRKQERKAKAAAEIEAARARGEAVD